MNTIEKSGFTKWCTNKGLEIADREWPIYKSTEPLSFLIKLPDNPYRGVALARMCFPGRVNSPFKGAMVWFREWGVWNKVDEETGMQTVQRLRAALGETRPLIEAPGHLFSVQEFPDARAFWNVPMIFGWDAILFPESADYFVFNSHDEVVAFVSRTKETHSQLMEDLKDWNPEVSAWYFR